MIQVAANSPDEPYDGKDHKGKAGEDQNKQLANLPDLGCAKREQDASRCGTERNQEFQRKHHQDGQDRNAGPRTIRLHQIQNYQ